MLSIHLIRHEEPELRGRFIGRTDPPLTVAGQQSAVAKLAGLEFAAIYVSPLRRARQTAAAIGGVVEPVVVPEFAEIDFGRWEGLTWQEIQERWPDTACRKVEDWLGVTAPGGETWIDFCARIDRALETVLAGPTPAAIVAHMVVNAALAARLLGSNPKRFRQDYGEILTCEAPYRDSEL
jgi:broad specificity phosphatase PhoE